MTDLRPEHLEELKRSAIAPELADDAGLRSISDDEAQEIGFRNGGGPVSGLLIPYPMIDPGERTRPGRLKPDHGDRKYLSVRGERPRFYLPPGTGAEELNDPSIDLDIVEGEKKALSHAGWSRRVCHKIAVVGIAGCWGWRQSVKGRQPDGSIGKVGGKPIADFDRVAWQGRRVRIILDGDIETNDDVARAARQLSAELQSRGAVVKIVHIPHGDDGKPRGADDVIAQEGDLKWAEVLNAPGWAREFPRTDSGNAELYADQHGDRVRYDHRLKRFLFWQGNYWTADADRHIRHLAKQTARERYRRSANISDSSQRKDEALWSIRFESRSAIDNILKLAQVEDPIADDGQDWDTNPDIIGAPNGIVELKTGTLRQGRPEDRVTMTTAVPFDPDAEAPRWMQFLDEVFEDDDKKLQQDVIDYVHRFIGYSLTGHTREQAFAILIGSGSNGKGKLINTVRLLLGDYGHNAAVSCFERTQGNSSHTEDRANLYGRRLITASETGQINLNENIVKSFVHADPQTVSKKFKSEFTYTPVGKVWFSTNDLPQVTDLTFGFWRSVRAIPFNRRFSDKNDDRHLDEKLHAEWPGILAWAVRGAVDWYKHGLGDPPEPIASKTAEYQQDSDDLNEFFDARCTIDKDKQVQSSLLHQEYRNWCDHEHITKKEQKGRKDFTNHVKKRFTRKKRDGIQFYIGIGIRTAS